KGVVFSRDAQRSAPLRVAAKRVFFPPHREQESRHVPGARAADGRLGLRARGLRDRRADSRPVDRAADETVRPERPEEGRGRGGRAEEGQGQGQDQAQGQGRGRGRRAQEGQGQDQAQGQVRGGRGHAEEGQGQGQGQGQGRGGGGQGPQAQDRAARGR